MGLFFLAPDPLPAASTIFMSVKMEAGLGCRQHFVVGSERPGGCESAGCGVVFEVTP